MRENQRSYYRCPDAEGKEKVSRRAANFFGGSHGREGKVFQLREEKLGDRKDKWPNEVPREKAESASLIHQLRAITVGGVDAGRGNGEQRMEGA